MWADASDVAADNPDAWIRDRPNRRRDRRESTSNRPVASPYPKLMTANLDVDQGGAVVMCSAAAAAAAGVSPDRWIYPWSGVSAADHWYPTNRWAFDESPAMRLAGARALELAAIGVDDCALIDLYSCFPAAVQVAQRELAIDADRRVHDHRWADVRRRTAQLLLHPAAGPCRPPAPRPTGASVPCSPATAATSRSTRCSCWPASRRRRVSSTTRCRQQVDALPIAPDARRRRSRGDDRDLHGDPRSRRCADASDPRLPRRRPARATSPQTDDADQLEVLLADDRCGLRRSTARGRASTDSGSESRARFEPGGAIAGVDDLHVADTVVGGGRERGAVHDRLAEGDELVEVRRRTSRPRASILPSAVST